MTGDGEITVQIRFGSHNITDVRLLRAIPRVGETVSFNYFDRPRDDYRVVDVRHIARDPEAGPDDWERGGARVDRPVVEVVVHRSDGAKS